MKTSLRLFVVWIISFGSVFAQSEPIEIIDISWRGGYCIGVHCTSQGAFSAKFKNLTDKTIVTVVWHYVLEDSVRQREYDRLKFVTDDKKIKPKETIKFTKRFDYSSPPNYVKAHVEIMAVKFADGSVWSRSKE